MSVRGPCIVFQYCATNVIRDKFKKTISGRSQTADNRLASNGFKSKTFVIAGMIMILDNHRGSARPDG